MILERKCELKTAGSVRTDLLMGADRAKDVVL
jgi:hypothetical protein